MKHSKALRASWVLPQRGRKFHGYAASVCSSADIAPLTQYAYTQVNGGLTACEWRWMPDENIAKKASKFSPDVRVKGSRGFAAGAPFGQEPFLRFSRMSINGGEQ